MFSWLGKKPAPSPPSATVPRDLEQLIFEIAEHGREEDHWALYRLMPGRHVCVAADPRTLPASATPGRPYTTKAGDGFQVRTATTPDGMPCLLVATRESSEAVAGGFVYMAWPDVLHMALELGGLGVILQGSTSWVGMDPQRVREILDSPEYR